MFHVKQPAKLVPAVIRAEAAAHFETTFDSHEKIVLALQGRFPQHAGEITPNTVIEWARRGQWTRPRRGSTYKGRKRQPILRAVDRPEPTWQSWMQ